MRWTDIPVHVIDFEGNVRTGVVEYGVVTLVGGEVHDVATRLCRPRAAVTDEETRVHHLSDRDLLEAKPFEDEWPYFAGLRETGVLCAHFAATENALLRKVWPSPRLSPDFLQAGATKSEWGPWIDTGRLIASISPPSISASLEHVVEHMGILGELQALAAVHCPSARSAFHCALFDALACALVLRSLAHDRDGSPWTLARVLADSTADARRRGEIEQPRWF